MDCGIWFASSSVLLIGAGSLRVVKLVVGVWLLCCCSGFVSCELYLLRVYDVIMMVKFTCSFNDITLWYGCCVNCLFGLDV